MQSAARYNRSRNRASRAVPFKRPRFWIICFFFLLWTVAILGRLFWLQVARHQEFVERAQKQQQRTFEVAPRRGVLFDRNAHELAMTVQVDSIYAVPAEISNKQAAAEALASIVHTDPDDAQTSVEQIVARMNKGGSFSWIARRVSPDVSAKVRDLVKAGTVKGIYFQKEFQRFYPVNQIAAQVLGYVGVDDNGLGGLEQKFEAQLHGVSGRMYTAVDARRRVLGSSEREPAAGRNLVLTIDENIQFRAERALDHAMQRTGAQSGTVVVQDVHTGQILALAVRPTFDPNQSRRTTPELLRNHAVSDVYEPGSTFKLVTYAAALDQHAVTPDEIIDCQGGAITIGKRTIHDDQGEHYGRITVHEALEHSSDVAAVKLAMKLGPERFSQYIHDFGFGARSGLELPGETRGLLSPVARWNGLSSLGSIAIGQEVAVTPLQLVSMVSTIANGGVYLPPHILMPGQLDSAVGGDKPAALPTPAPFRPGEDLPNPLPPGAHRVISTLTAAQMRKMMEGVVLYGTGKDAQLNGYSSGGKTGTAQKIDPATHKYSKTMHVASFAGIAPVNNPVIAVAVVMDNPKGDYHGSHVSAPVFTEVAQQVLEYLGVAHDTGVHAPRPTTTAHGTEDESGEHTGDVEALFSAANDLPSDDPLRAVASAPAEAQKARSASSPAGVQGKTVSAPAVPAVSGGATQSTPAIRANGSDKPVPPPAPARVVLQESGKLRVPSLIGLPLRKVIEQAGAAGLEVQVSGSGTVREQAPAAGTMVTPGTQIVVRCGR